MTMPDNENLTAPLDRQLHVPLTALEFTLIVFISNSEGFDASAWMRRLLTIGVRNQLHRELKDMLFARISGDDDDSRGR